jgi:hypothetical protein
MAFFNDPVDIASLSYALLFILLSAHRALEASIAIDFLPRVEDGDDGPIYVDQLGQPMFDADQMMQATLHNFSLCNIFAIFDDNLGFWVKLRSTTWFLPFLLEQYDDS